MRALLDGDVVAYQACAVASGGESTAVQWADDVEDEGSSLDKAIGYAEDKVLEWMQFAGANDCIIAFSGDSDANFRRAVNPEYKANRSTEKPAHYAEVVEYLKQEYPWRAEDCLEGDDILGLLITEPPLDRLQVVVSTDKDIYTLPGKVLRVPHSLKKDVAWGYTENSEEDANRYWMTQVLTGDAVDGYRGCPGVGPAAAEKALADVHSLEAMWGRVCELYAKMANHKKWGAKFVHRGSPGREALMNARCARILRHGDYDYDERRVKLWAIQ